MRNTARYAKLRYARVRMVRKPIQASKADAQILLQQVQRIRDRPRTRTGNKARIRLRVLRI